MAQWVKYLASIPKYVGLIPGLAQWVKDLALPQAAAEFADAAWIWCCSGYSIGWQLMLQFHP